MAVDWAVAREKYQAMQAAAAPAGECWEDPAVMAFLGGQIQMPSPCSERRTKKADLDFELEGLFKGSSLTQQC